MPGNRHVTIGDVARMAKVSRTLVSFVLNGRKDVAPATRVRILQAIEELGYRPNAVARNLARKRAGAIGIVCDMETYQDPLDMQFLAAILTTASEMEQRVMLIPADERQIQEVAQDHAVDGVIFLDERVADPRIAHLQTMGIPAVGLWGGYLNETLRVGVEELALHLDSRGLKQVVCLYESCDKLFVKEFKQTLTDILQEYNIAFTVYHCPPETEAEVVRAVAQELKRSGSTAIVASSDKLAINAIHGLHAARLHVPDDCAVTGFGDVPAAQWVQPRLTTIRVPVKAMALRAMGRVFRDEDVVKQFPAVSCRLIVRRSC
ncbi:MAG TPA: LacI family DNA-binding transcriptional regulator [Ktedonobacteraceae bacterium]